MNVPCLRKPYQDTRDRAAIRGICRVHFMASPVQWEGETVTDR